MLQEEERPSIPAANPVASNSARVPKKRRWLTLTLVLLVVLLVIGGVSSIVIYQNNVEKVEKDKKVDAAHNAYIASLSGNGTMAFSDPLREASGSQWSSETTTSGTCQWTDGSYHVKQQSGAFMGCNARGTYSNFAFEVQLTIIQGCGGIVFRDKGDGYFYYFSICSYGMPGRYDIARYANYGNFKQLPYGESSAIHVGAGESNKLAVAAIGNSMTFYINEQQIAQALDTPSVAYTEGSIGLAAYPNFGSVAHVAYTKATLWTI